MKKVTAGAYYDHSPSFGPEGQQVYFSSNRVGPTWRIWRVNYGHAGGQTQITRGEGSGLDFQPCVSSKGDLAFASLPSGAQIPQVWVRTKDSPLLTQLKEGEAPDWSPDGSRIAFEVADPESGQRNIWIMDADGGELTQITSSRWNDTEPSWSADGKKIAFASNRGKDQSGRQNYDIWTINTDGTELTQLTTNGSFDDLPEWGPNGDVIYFRSNRGVSWNIWSMKLVD